MALLLAIRISLSDQFVPKSLNSQKLHIFLFLSGDQATFNCTVMSGFRAGARLVVIEVTDRDHPEQYPMSSFTAANLTIPLGKERFTRRFACGLLEHEELRARSDEAELFIIPRGTAKLYHFKILSLMK